MIEPDVLIVGAGPTGLVLALWLTRPGVAVRIIDKNPQPSTTSRALAVQGAHARVLSPDPLSDRRDARLAGVFDVTPDGKTFFMLRTRGREQVSVILNWPRDLAQIEAAGRSPAR